MLTVLGGAGPVTGPSLVLGRRGIRSPIAIRGLGATYAPKGRVSTRQVAAHVCCARTNGASTAIAASTPQVAVSTISGATEGETRRRRRSAHSRDVPVRATPGTHARLKGRTEEGAS